MKLIDELLITTPNGVVREIRVGPFITAVVVEVDGLQRCGLASTADEAESHHHSGQPAVRNAGRLEEHSARELAELARSAGPMETTIGMATINALLPTYEEQAVEINAFDVIAEEGKGKNVALVGHFPFVPRLQEQVGKLWVLEQEPQGTDLPAEAAPDIIPQADVIAMTGVTLINHTFEELMALRRPETPVIMLGPTTPLSPILFDHDIDILSGAVVEDTDVVLRSVSQGATFRQARQQGVRLMTMQKMQGICNLSPRRGSIEVTT